MRLQKRRITNDPEGYHKDHVKEGSASTKRGERSLSKPSSKLALDPRMPQTEDCPSPGAFTLDYLRQFLIGHPNRVHRFNNTWVEMSWWLATSRKRGVSSHEVVPPCLTARSTSAMTLPSKDDHIMYSKSRQAGQKQTYNRHLSPSFSMA